MAGKPDPSDIFRSSASTLRQLLLVAFGRLTDLATNFISRSNQLRAIGVVRAAAALEEKLVTLHLPESIPDLLGTPNELLQAGQLFSSLNQLLDLDKTRICLPAAQIVSPVRILLSESV